jgi:thiamine-phosphate pyrophosphorylase
MSTFKLAPPLLCLVTDPVLPDLIPRVEQALAAGVNMLQLRGHELPARHIYELALSLRPLCQQHHVALLINDRVDVGLAVKADGFQLGSRSLPLSVVAQLAGQDYLLGASIHSVEEAHVARENGADFLLAGTIFASRSHPTRAPQGIRFLYEIKQSIPDCSLLAIGGITANNARQVMQAGADGIAVISAILSASDVTQAVRELRAAISA